jgi:hypothetical protein
VNAIDEKLRMMLEQLSGYNIMHGRDMHKDPEAWSEEIRKRHLAIVDYVEEIESAAMAVLQCRLKFVKDAPGYRTWQGHDRRYERLAKALGVLV